MSTKYCEIAVEYPALRDLDGPIRANQTIRANHFGVPELNPFLANRALGG